MFLTKNLEKRQKLTFLIGYTLYFFFLIGDGFFTFTQYIAFDEKVLLEILFLAKILLHPHRPDK